MSKREFLCVTLGLDSSELGDYRYHYGRTNIPVYAIGDDYFCVTRIKEKPAKHNYDMEWIWTEVERNTNHIIWKSNS